MLMKKKNISNRSTDLCQLDLYKSFSECQKNERLGIYVFFLQFVFLFTVINSRINSASEVDREQRGCAALENALHEIKLLPAV